VSFVFKAVGDIKQYASWLYLIILQSVLWQTGPYLLPKWVLHRAWSSAASFNFHGYACIWY